VGPGIKGSGYRKRRAHAHPDEKRLQQRLDRAEVDQGLEVQDVNARVGMAALKQPAAARQSFDVQLGVAPAH
jgi:hypothetical protein